MSKTSTSTEGVRETRVAEIDVTTQPGRLTPVLLFTQGQMEQFVPRGRNGTKEGQMNGESFEVPIMSCGRFLDNSRTSIAFGER